MTTLNDASLSCGAHMLKPRKNWLRKAIMQFWKHLTHRPYRRIEGSLAVPPSLAPMLSYKKRAGNQSTGVSKQALAE
jgi:hypothetical protein